MVKRRSRRFTVAMLAVQLIGGTAAAALVPAPAEAETAVQPERNPPGDIPDTQVFVAYAPKAGYALKVPEGWARSGDPKNIRFVDKLDGVAVTLSDIKAAPTLKWVKSSYLPEMIKADRAVEVSSVKEVTLPAGPAIRIAYAVNSAPNPVTSKQIRLEAQRFLFWQSGTMAALELWAPAGADNVDQWKLMSESFRWQ